MMNDTELWEKVKLLQGTTLYTYKELEPNSILRVEDTGNATDAILIKDRITRPIKEDIIAAYKLLFTQGKLERDNDLAWLAQPNKKTSSITFRIVGELAKDKIEVIEKNKVILKLKLPNILNK